MSEELWRRKVLRLQARVDALEAMIEDRSREVFVANTKLQEAAEFLQEVYRTMPGALLVFDRQGRIEAVNDAAARMLEYADGALVGQPVDAIIDPADPITTSELRSLLGADAVLHSEKTCLSRTGRRIPVLISATLLGRASGERSVRGVVCVALDLSDRKQLEVELRQAQKLESVGRLASGVAHEINTPVQFISDSVHFARDAIADLFGVLDQLQQVAGLVRDGADAGPAAMEAAAAEETADLGYLRDELPAALDRALDGLGRVATIVRSMKEFAHPDQREMTRVDLNRAIDSTLTISRGEYKLVADVETELGPLPPVRCHGGDINQVVLNLLVNAAHAITDAVAGSERRGLIRVTTRHLPDVAMVEISVSDTGGGIPPAIREKIFDPFFTTKGVGKGSGQGLALARSVVVERHGGELTFTTEVGLGTTFVIRLPVDGRSTPATQEAA